MIFIKTVFYLFVTNQYENKTLTLTNLTVLYKIDTLQFVTRKRNNYT